ncbi:non-homologous end-joining DNA ligase [Actinospica sp. MGRD01-02]|uniref:Non-homologous end-joining DNA ligase n=1 Tax=Actinospica acidithermotolerans TaxID=2828514 RepID=A0A941E8N2_9ACTN|nr:non-homologous end-joining DNA ligase [Actinospica acidithermotolerans]MBR7827076.1 non-homologous end-joining DNA ligase [Actinospica acidithermotolerans]
MGSNEAFVTVAGRSVRISSPDKVCYPAVGVTKLELAEYCIAVAEGLMRALAGRPMALHRFPGGLAGGDSFYMKHAPKSLPDWVQTVKVTFPSGRTGYEVCVTEPATVVWAVQMNALELHPWPVRREDTDRPDELRIDLDPEAGSGFAKAVEAATEARALFDELGMVPFVKTSGGRGLHILVRIEPRWSFIETRRAVIAFARELERRRPDLFTTSWWKEERSAPVFVDFNQMARDRMLAAAYSTRAVPDARVSTPVRWPDLPDAAPEDFTVRTVPALLAERGDAHEGIDDESAALDALLEMAERDERDRGLGDLPYPPEFPKMPGEPKRVQPSKARHTTAETS